MSCRTFPLAVKKGGMESQDMYAGNEDTVGDAAFLGEARSAELQWFASVLLHAASWNTQEHAHMLCSSGSWQQSQMTAMEGVWGNLHDRLGVCSRDIAKTGSKFQPAVFSCTPGQGWDTLLHAEAKWRWRDWLGNIFLTDNAFLPTNFYLEGKTMFWHSDLEGLPKSEGKSALWHPVNPQVMWQKWQGDVSARKQGALRKDWPFQEVTQIRALPFDPFSISYHWPKNTHLLLELIQLFLTISNSLFIPLHQKC